jgi:hypothetical protein
MSNEKEFSVNDLINLTASLNIKDNSNFDYNYDKIFKNIVVINKILLKNKLSESELSYLKLHEKEFSAIPTKKDNSNDEKLTAIKNKLRVGLRVTRKILTKKNELKAVTVINSLCD